MTALLLFFALLPAVAYVLWVGWKLRRSYRESQAWLVARRLRGFEPTPPKGPTR